MACPFLFHKERYVDNGMNGSSALLNGVFRAATTAPAGSNDSSSDKIKNKKAGPKPCL